MLKSLSLLSPLLKMAEIPTKRHCSGVAGDLKIAVEGNIAAGKSTFLSILMDHSKSYHVVGEPLNRWTNVPADDEDITASQQYGSNLLDMFYRDPKRYAYTFQTYACLSRLRAQLRVLPEHLKSVPNPVIFYERSVYSDKFCFAMNCHESGLINDVEWSVYCDWHSFLVQYLQLQFDGFIYLRSSPEVAMRRLKKRGRPEECDVTLDYLRSLHIKHNDWLIDKKIKPLESMQREVPVLVIDCDDEFEDSEEKQAKILGQVDKFIDSILITDH